MLSNLIQLSALERDSGANIVFFMHTPNKTVSSFRTRAYGKIGKKLVKKPAFRLCKLQLKTAVQEFEGKLFIWRFYDKFITLAIFVYKHHVPQSGKPRNIQKMKTTQLVKMILFQMKKKWIEVIKICACARTIEMC